MNIIFINNKQFSIIFRGTENLRHRLFVCIAGVADQLQTNFASDLRQILRSVFLINTSPPQEEIKIPEKPKETDMFEFRASENDVIHENSGGSNQSIYSAEEVSPEIDCVFDNPQVTSSNRGDRSASVGSDERVQISQPNHNERSRSLGETPSCDELPNRQYNDNNIRSNTIRERIRKTSSNHDSDSSSHESYSPQHSPINNNRVTNDHHHNTHQQSQHNCRLTTTTSNNHRVNNTKPPRWIPDEEAPRCMSCAVLFTAFRRRHHCRNCGGVFCGVCSNSSAPLPKFGLLKAVRVCRDCYTREVGA